MSLLSWLFGAQLFFSCTGTYNVHDLKYGHVDDDHAPTTASLMLDVTNKKWRFAPVHGTENFASLDTPDRHCRNIDVLTIPDSLCKTFQENGDTIDFGYRYIGHSKDGFSSDKDVFASFNRVTGKLDFIHKWAVKFSWNEQSNQYNHDYEMSCVKSDKMF
jgi:hypothetical protein